MVPFGLHSLFQNFMRSLLQKQNIMAYAARQGTDTFSLEKMTYVKETGHVIYKSKMTHGKNRKNFEVYEAKAFIVMCKIFRNGCGKGKA